MSEVVKIHSSVHSQSESGFCLSHIRSYMLIPVLWTTCVFFLPSLYSKVSGHPLVVDVCVLRVISFFIPFITWCFPATEFGFHCISETGTHCIWVSYLCVWLFRAYRKVLVLHRQVEPFNTQGLVP